jgi:Zn2+/Cd2+-exporting ATPase
VRIVDELKAEYGPTLMIGDGMNDAPALAKADVGVSMGVSGSAAAMETSHITLMSNDIRRIPKAVQLARRTHRTIIVNIIFSVTTKLAIVGLALAGHPHIWAAVLADVGTCLLVIMYSMLLLRGKGGRNAKKCCDSSRHGSHTAKHCVSHHCSDGPCKSIGSCKESSSGKHGCHDHGHSHNHCREPSGQKSTEKHGCHDHGHGHSHCREPNNLLLTDNHVFHDHGRNHNHCQEPSIPGFAHKSGCHDHEHNHSKRSDTSDSISESACHAHEHTQCEEHKHSHSSGGHGCHEHEHSHCKQEPIVSHSTSDHVCPDHDLEHMHHCHAEHTADTYNCHGHDRDHAEIEETEKDCQAELHHHHSHCCHEPHGEDNSAADSAEEHSVSIDATAEIQEQHSHCGHLNEPQKEEGCGSHLKAKDCAPHPVNHISRNCCSVTVNKGCGSKGEDVCSSLQAVCAKEPSRCRRGYVKCHRTTSCCSHNTLKLPEIIVE